MVEYRSSNWTIYPRIALDIDVAAAATARVDLTCLGQRYTTQKFAVSDVAYLYEYVVLVCEQA